MAVDPTARVESGAFIGAEVSIGPFCVVGPHVVLGDGCRLVSHVTVVGHTTIGARTVVHPFASLGGEPQWIGYSGGPTRLVIGADCTIRENVTMNVGSVEGGGVTTVGDRSFFMAGSHVAHDCCVGSDVIFANAATLGGHCVVGDHVFFGGLSAAHQFTHIGSHAMISGVTGLRGDVIPFGMAAGAFARLAGVNIVGMRRRKFSAEAIRAVRSAYRMLFLAEGSLAQRVGAVESALGSEPAVAEIVTFVRAERRRPLCQPGTHHEV